MAYTNESTNKSDLVGMLHSEHGYDLPTAYAVSFALGDGLALDGNLLNGDVLTQFSPDQAEMILTELSDLTNSITEVQKLFKDALETKKG